MLDDHILQSTRAVGVVSPAILRLIQARRTFLARQAVDAADLGKPPPPLTSETHALPLVAISSTDSFEIAYTPHPDWVRVVAEVSALADCAE